MCFYDANQMACKCWKWGHFRQHCSKEYRTGETCGMKLVMNRYSLATKCKICTKIDTRSRSIRKEEERIRRWGEEHGHTPGITKGQEVIVSKQYNIQKLLHEREVNRQTWELLKSKEEERIRLGEGSSSEAREHKAPSTATNIYEPIQTQQFGEENSPHTERDLLYMTDLEPSSMIALAETSKSQEAPLLRDATRKHDGNPTSVQAKSGLQGDTPSSNKSSEEQTLPDPKSSGKGSLAAKFQKLRALMKDKSFATIDEEIEATKRVLETLEEVTSNSNAVAPAHPPTVSTAPLTGNPQKPTPSINCFPTFQSTYEKVKENGRRVLRVLLKGVEHMALPDSGSDKNIISSQFAADNKIKVRKGRNDKRIFELGDGTYVHSIGRAHIPCSLPNPQGFLSTRKRWFHVLMECVVPLILGKGFLDETEVLTKNTHLLERCPVDYFTIPSLKFIGTPRNRSGIGVSMDRRLLVATPDTGSDLNLISLACANREGFHINRSPEGCIRLQVADGSEVETVGQVYVSSLSLNLRMDQSLPEHNIDSVDYLDDLEDLKANDYTEPTGEIFYVVDGLPCDLILGDAFLDKTNAFNAGVRISCDPLVRLEKHKLPSIKIFRVMGPIQALFCRKQERKKENEEERAEREQYERFRAERHQRQKERRKLEELAEEKIVKPLVKESTAVQE